MMNDLMMNSVLEHLLRGLVWVSVCLVAGLALKQTKLKGWLGRAAIAMMLVIAIVPLIPGLGGIEVVSQPPMVVKTIPLNEPVALGSVNEVIVKERVDLPVQRDGALLLGWAWVVGVGLFLIRLIWGQVMLWKFSRLTRALESVRWQAGLEGLASEMPKAKRVRLVTKSGVEVPVTWGWRRPMILIPAGLVETASDEELDMVLRHELSHVSGGDCFFGILGRLGVALHWVNPFAWMMDRWVMRTREESADLAVLEGGHQQGDYAAFLVRLASGADVNRAPVVAMAQSSSVPGRVEKILSGALQSGGSGAGGVILALVVGVGFALAATVFGKEEDSAEPVSGEIVAPKAEHQILMTTRFIEVPKALLGREVGEGIIQLPSEGKTKNYSELEIEKMLSALSQQEGVSVLSAPSVVTRSGEKAAFEIGNEADPSQGFRLELDAEVLRDGETVALGIDLDRPQWKTDLTLTEKRSVVFAGNDKEGTVRLVIVGASIVNAPRKPEPVLDIEAEKRRLLDSGLGEKHPKILRLEKKIREALADDPFPATVGVVDFTPDDWYLDAYITMNRAEEESDAEDKLLGLKRALEKFNKIVAKAPEWHPKMLEYRIGSVNQMIKEVKAGKLNALSEESAKGVTGEKLKP